MGVMESNVTIFFRYYLFYTNQSIMLIICGIIKKYHYLVELLKNYFIFLFSYGLLTLFWKIFFSMKIIVDEFQNSTAYYDAKYFFHSKNIISMIKLLILIKTIYKNSLRI